MSLAIYRPNEALAEKSTFEIMPMALELAKQLGETEFVPTALRHRPAAIMAAILQGHEVGLPPMMSLQHVNVIEGKPSLSAASMRALILARGHEIWIEEQTQTRAIVCGRRKGQDRVLSCVWTIDDAKRAILVNKTNWQRYPRNMLVARATGDCGRGAFMDVLGGIAYTTEELEDEQGQPPAGTPAPGPQAPAPTGTTRRRRAQRSAVAEPPPPPPAPEPGPPPAPDPEPPPLEGEVVPEPPPAPAPEPAEQPAVTTPPLPLAGEAMPGENLTLAQKIAIVCRENGIDRQRLILAATGKEHGRDLTREEAAFVLEEAKALARNEKRLVYADDHWLILPVEAPQT